MPGTSAVRICPRSGISILTVIAISIRATLNLVFRTAITSVSYTISEGADQGVSTKSRSICWRACACEWNASNRCGHGNCRIRWCRYRWCRYLRDNRRCNLAIGKKSSTDDVSSLVRISYALLEIAGTTGIIRDLDTPWSSSACIQTKLISPGVYRRDIQHIIV